MAETIRTEITNTTMTEKKQKEKGRKWDGLSRVPTPQYKKNWDDIFGNRNVVRTEASFKSRDYSDETIYKSKGNRKSDKSSD